MPESIGPTFILPYCPTPVLLQKSDRIRMIIEGDPDTTAPRNDDILAGEDSEIIPAWVAVLESRVDRDPSIPAQIKLRPDMIPFQRRNHVQMPGRDAPGAEQ